MRAAIALVAVWMGAVKMCQEVKGEAPKPAGDIGAFTGIWIPQSSMFDGKEQLPDKADRDRIRLSIEGGEYKLYLLTDPVKLIGQRVSTADLTADDKAGTFELTIKEGIKKGVKLHGIFEMGKTTLKMCYGPADKPRPTKFEAPVGGDGFCDIWDRYKK